MGKQARIGETCLRISHSMCSHRRHHRHHRPPSEHNANDDFTAAFLKYAGDDVVLSPPELGELVGLAMGETAPLTRHSVLQILQQWDQNYDGGLNLSEFMRMYGELQHQMPSTFQQHWENIRHFQDKTDLADHVGNDIQSQNCNI